MKFGPKMLKNGGTPLFTPLQSIQPWKQRIQMCEEAQICMFFFIFRGVKNLNLVFLSHYLTKFRCFCAHWKGNFLNFSKLT